MLSHTCLKLGTAKLFLFKKRIIHVTKYLWCKMWKQWFISN